MDISKTKTIYECVNNILDHIDTSEKKNQIYFLPGYYLILCFLLKGIYNDRPAAKKLLELVPKNSETDILEVIRICESNKKAFSIKSKNTLEHHMQLNQETEKMIKLFSMDVSKTPSSEKVFQVTNLVNFNAEWGQMFYKYKKLNFESVGPVDFMSLEKKFDHVEFDSGADLVKVPYANPEYEAIIVNSVEMDVNDIMRPENEIETDKFKLIFPMFNLKYEHRGMTDLLKPLEKGFEDHELLAPILKQKTEINVDTTGTVVISKTKSETRWGFGDTFVVNKPFTFIVAHRETKMILFYAKIYDPSK